MSAITPVTTSTTTQPPMIDPKNTIDKWFGGAIRKLNEKRATEGNPLFDTDPDNLDRDDYQIVTEFGIVAYTHKNMVMLHEKDVKETTLIAEITRLKNDIATRESDLRQLKTEAVQYMNDIARLKASNDKYEQQAIAQSAQLTECTKQNSLKDVMIADLNAECLKYTGGHIDPQSTNILNALGIDMNSFKALMSDPSFAQDLRTCVKSKIDAKIADQQRALAAASAISNVGSNTIGQNPTGSNPSTITFGTTTGQTVTAVDPKTFTPEEMKVLREKLKNYLLSNVDKHGYKLNAIGNYPAGMIIKGLIAFGHDFSKK